MGSGCVSVGSTVCSDTRGPRFESSHGQNFNICLPTVNCIEKTKITKKRPGMAHFLKKYCRLSRANAEWLCKKMVPLLARYFLQITNFPTFTTVKLCKNISPWRLLLRGYEVVHDRVDGIRLERGLAPQRSLRRFSLVMEHWRRLEWSWDRPRDLGPNQRIYFVTYLCHHITST